ncbi:hypothetical protein K435DRAFT_782280 [Dendrothele bispora CBS 962.96]|uniref:Major facilitator superfamily (MFS) profile domain-containing protein n=1 Tax=Dendrothele bispora (strain CBS 962.96) TaxID=1314807 RepID=A0A4S8LFY4_DENBC|nr:hypothetical protein K435DRAFT_782280 [Dendrothele bispora CBS 962.96]
MALFYRRGVPIGGVAIMLALLASMGGFIFGYDTGQISDILLMRDFLHRFATCQPGATIENATSQCAFNVWRSGLIVSLLSIGTLFGALFGAPTADLLGRRYAMVTECMLFIVGVIIQITSTNVWQQFAVGRLVSGLAVGALSAAVPMYQAETAPAMIRGALTATYQLFITFGIFVAYCISIGARDIDGAGSWRLVVGIGIIWPFILGTGMLFMPESPRWLASKGRYEEAHYSIARTHAVPSSEALTSPLTTRLISEIRSNLEHLARLREKPLNDSSDPEKSISSSSSIPHKQRSSLPSPLTSWLACFSPTSKTLYRTLLGMTLQSLQQLTGANYFFYYGATIFTSVGIQDSFVTQIILGAVNFGCTFGGLWVMEKFGRRTPLIIGGLWQSAWLFVFAAAGTAKDPHTDSNIGKLMIVSACLFILGYATTWGPCIWILIGETFPTRTRAKQGALATASNWLWNFLLAMFTPLIANDIEFAYGFVFAACNLAGAIVVYLFLYESAHLSLEAVDDMYNDPECRPWTSSRWVPVGYKDRMDLVEQRKAEEAEAGAEGGAGAGAEVGGAEGVGAGGGGKKGYYGFEGKEEGREEHEVGVGVGNGNGSEGRIEGVNGTPYTMAPKETV